MENLHVSFTPKLMVCFLLKTGDPMVSRFQFDRTQQKKLLEKNIRNSSVFPGSFPEFHAFLVGPSLIFTVLTLTWCEAGAHDPHSWWRVRKALANP